MSRLDFAHWKPTFFLAVLTIAVVGVAAAMLLPQESAPTLLPPPAPAPVLATPVGYEPPAKEQFRAIVERPLFIASRRPFVPEPPPPAPAPAAPPAAAAAPPPPPAPPPASLRQTHTLIGIVEADGERTALLRANAGAIVVRVAEGASLQGWTLHQVGPDALRVRAGDTEEVIEFPKTIPVAPMRPPGPSQPLPMAGPAMTPQRPR